MLLLRATAKNTSVAFLARSGCTLQKVKNLFTPRVDEVRRCAVKARSETQGLEWVCLWYKRENIFRRGHLLSHLFCQEGASNN